MLYSHKIKQPASNTLAGNALKVLTTRPISIFLLLYFEIQSTFQKRVLNSNTAHLRKSIRRLILFFIISLVISGATAFFIETGLSWILPLFHGVNNKLSAWLRITYEAAREVNIKYPFMAYGYDWLAFAHLVIAVAFIGPLKDPVKNIWIIQFGMIACLMIIPLAFIAGHFRQIPIFWRLIDSSFGVIGIIPLASCYYKITLLEKINCGSNDVEVFN